MMSRLILAPFWPVLLFPVVSRAIRDALDAGKIKLADPEQTSLRYRHYVPFWA